MKLASWVGTRIKGLCKMSVKNTYLAEFTAKLQCLRILPFSLVMLIFSYVIPAQAGHFQMGCGVHQSFIQKINYIGSYKPTCLVPFVNDLKNDSIANPQNAEKNRLWAEAALAAKKNVRTLRCPQGESNVTFVSSKVFVTAGHAFFRIVRDTATGTSKAVERFPNEVLQSCFVTYFDLQAGRYKQNPIDITISPRHGRVSAILEDYGVAVVRDEIDDIVEGPIAEGLAVANKEMLSGSPNRDYSWTKNCFSPVICPSEKYFAPNAESGSVHITQCPGEIGTSGNGYYSLIQDKDGRYTSFALVGVHVGSRTNLPNGTPYKYGKDAAAMFTATIGIEGKFRSDLAEVLDEVRSKRFDKNAELLPQNPAQDL